MTSVNVTTTKNTVTVNGETRVVTVKTAGPQGTFTDGNLGDVTVSSNGTNIVVNSGAIDNAKVASNAAISGTKISPDFGSQNITTTGNLTLSSTSPSILLTEGDANPDYIIKSQGGIFKVRDQTNGVDRISVNTDGHVDVAGNLDVGAGVDITGDLTTTGNLTISSTTPQIFLTDTNHDSDYKILVENGSYHIFDVTNSATRIRVDASGNIDLKGNVDCEAGLDVTGDLTVSGNMTVSGTTTTIDTTTLTVEDKNIELGKVSTPTDTTADQGGITLLGATNKTFQWLDATDSWTSSEHIALPDDKRIKLGASQDLQIFHNFAGSKNFISTIGNNDLIITGRRTDIKNDSNNETLASFIKNEAVEAYFDNVKRLETTATGIKVTGTTTTGSEFLGDFRVKGTDDSTFVTFKPAENLVRWQDNKKATFGDLNDLQIYHDSTNSIINNDTNIFRVRSNHLLLSQTNNSRYLQGNSGVVDLFYDNAVKLTTTSTGALLGDHTGSAVNTLSQGVLDLGGQYSNTDGTPKLFLYKDASNNYVGFGVSDSQLDVCLSQTAYDFVIYQGTNELFRVEGTGNIQIPADDKKLQIGASQDLELYHDGSHSRIVDAGTGNLIIQTDGYRLRSTDGTEVLMMASKNNSVDLYYDNVKRLETTSTGNKSTGTFEFLHSTGAARAKITQDGNYKNEDGVKFIAGTGNDLQIYHDGSNSIITNSTGTLLIRSDNLDLRPHTNNSEVYLRCTQNAAVQLRYDSVTKFETTSTGTKVSGDLEINGNVSGGILKLRTTNDNVGAIINFDNAHTTTGWNVGMTNDNTGRQSIYTAENKDATVWTNNTLRTVVTGDGNFQIPADDAKLQIGASQDLQIFHDGTDSRIHNSTNRLVIRTSTIAGFWNSNGSEVLALFNVNGSADLYFDHSKKLETTSTGVSVTGDITGTGGLTLTSTDSGSSAAPEILLFRDSSSAADADYLGQIKFQGRDDQGSTEQYAKITGKIDDASAGNEDGILEFMLRKASTNNICGRFTSTALKLINGTALEIDGTDATINSITVGKGANSVAGNTVLGESALDAAVTGGNNTAIGANSCTTLTSGTNNTGVGSASLLLLTTGSNNTALGRQTLDSTTTGSQNVAIGSAALAANTTADNNTAVGYTALLSNTTGASHVAVGSLALSANTTGTHNTAVGRQTLKTNTTGNYNVAIGLNALIFSTTASNNVAVGAQASQENTTGTSNVAIGFDVLRNSTTASNNTGLGYQSLRANTTGGLNTAIGNTALTANTSGVQNTAVGALAMDANTTGSYNSALGLSALGSNTTANNNTAVGANSLAANTTGTGNTGVGALALNANTTGNYNNSYGFQALYYNTTGSQNVALGHTALGNNTTASNNTAVGYYALLANTTGANNAALGAYALDANTTGGSNVAVGSNSLSANTTASDNVAIGVNSLLSNTTGTSNTAVGKNSLFNNTTASNNTAMGDDALLANTTGISLVAVGRSALTANTTADYNNGFGAYTLSANTTGTNNLAVGHAALLKNTTASNNTGLGFNALKENTTGEQNTALGSFALDANTTSSNCTAIGYNSLIASTGSNNTAIGRHSGFLITTGANNVCIGNASGTNVSPFGITTQSNRLVLGDNSITNAYIKVAFTVTSDERDKTDIQDITTGLDFVNKLKPKSFWFRKERGSDEKAGQQRYGFIAQDILALEGNNPVIIDNEQEDHLKYKGEHLIPILVKAIQELTIEVNKLKSNG